MSYTSKLSAELSFGFISILKSEKARVLRAEEAAGNEPVSLRTTDATGAPASVCAPRKSQLIGRFVLYCRSGGLFLRERVEGGGVSGCSNQRWRQGRPSWSRCAACGDLRGPTAWTSRGYFWRGFVRLDTSSKSREEGRGITDTLFVLREPPVIPAATWEWWRHVSFHGKRLVGDVNTPEMRLSALFRAPLGSVV